MRLDNNRYLGTIRQRDLVGQDNRPVFNPTMEDHVSILGISKSKYKPHFNPLAMNYVINTAITSPNSIAQTRCLSSRASARVVTLRFGIPQAFAFDDYFALPRCVR